MLASAPREPREAGSAKGAGGKGGGEGGKGGAGAADGATVTSYREAARAWGNPSEFGAPSGHTEHMPDMQRHSGRQLEPL